jgi:hypothetical protein
VKSSGSCTNSVASPTTKLELISRKADLFQLAVSKLDGEGLEGVRLLTYSTVVRRVLIASVSTTCLQHNLVEAEIVCFSKSARANPSISSNT